MNDAYQDKAPARENKTKKPAGSKYRKEIKPPKKISERYLYNSGLAYLQRFPASSMHFKSVMMRKIQKSCRHHVDQNIEDCAAMLDPLVEKFRELGFLDDKAYLNGMVTSLRRRGLSSSIIRLRLQQKGYDADTIMNALRDYDLEEFDTDYEGDYHAALIFARKKKLGVFDVMNRKTPEKAMATMARAGYSYGIIKKILEIEEEDLDDYL